MNERAQVSKLHAQRNKITAKPLVPVRLIGVHKIKAVRAQII
ncbi:MAG: hypothetical protein ACTIJG_04640 [Staphylococcus saprophyticus]